MSGVVKWAFTVLRKCMYHNLLVYIMLILICYDSSLIFMLQFVFSFSSFRTYQESQNGYSCVANFFWKYAFLFLMLLRHIQKDFRHMVSCFSSSPLGITHSKSLLHCQNINTIPANSLGQAAFTSVKTWG